MYKRRLKIFLAVMAVGVAVVLARLAQLQLVQGEDYRRQAEEMLTYVEILPSARGQILDRKGRVLAWDEPCFDFCLDYRMLTHGEQAYDLSLEYRLLSPADRWARRQIDQLAGAEKTSSRHAAMFRKLVEQTWKLAETVTGASRNEMAGAAENAVRRVQAIRRIVGGPVALENEGHPMVTGLDENVAVELRSRLGRMVGASVLPSHRRRYPYGELACHAIGLLGPVGKDQLQEAEANGALPLEARLSEYLSGELIGELGVEKLCEQLPAADGGAEGAAGPRGLRGWRGYRRIHRTSGLLEEVPARPGRDIHLTIDIELQRALSGVFAESLARLAKDLNQPELPDRPGAIVVIDVPTGEVLAMVSRPGFDLNAYRREYPRLAADAVNLPLWDRTVLVRYPPGSTFKPLAALAALRGGEITATTSFECRGYLHSPDAFRCWNQNGHGSLSVVAALEHSCNVFFYNVGEQVGLRRMCAWLAELGFDGPPGTALPQERPALLPDPRSVRGVGEARFLAIGQGQVLVTPMHVANAMAAIARGGEFRSPLLVRELAVGQVRRRLGATAEQVALVAEGMYDVVNSPSGGTAYRHYEPQLDPQTRVAGKTGTAQTAPQRVDSNGDGRIDQTDKIVREGDTAWFAGFAPYREPRIAFAVVVEYARAGGGYICGPVARQVVRVCRGFGYL